MVLWRGWRLGYRRRSHMQYGSARASLQALQGSAGQTVEDRRGFGSGTAHTLGVDLGQLPQQEDARRWQRLLGLADLAQQVVQDGGVLAGAQHILQVGCAATQAPGRAAV